MSAFEPRPTSQPPKSRDPIGRHLDHQRTTQLDDSSARRSSNLNILRKKLRDQASFHLSALSASIPLPSSIPSQSLPPGYLQDHDGNITFVGTARQAFTLLLNTQSNPRAEELGLLGLRMYYAQLAMGRDQVLAIPALELVNALHDVLKRRSPHTEAACVVLSLLAAKHIEFACEMQDQVLPTLNTLVRSQGQAPPRLRTAALIVFQNLAQHNPDLVGPYTSMLAFALTVDEAGIEGKEGESEVRKHAACALRYLCLPCDELALRDADAATIRAYETNHVPRLFDILISILRRDPAAEVRGYALSALERLSTGRSEVIDRLTLEAEGLELVATQLLPPDQYVSLKTRGLPPPSIPLEWRLVPDVLGVFQGILESPKTKHVASVLPYIPTLWALAQTKPTHVQKVCELFFLAVTDGSLEPSTAVFQTLFPAPASVDPTLAHLKAHGRSSGAQLLALLWRSITDVQQQALLKCVPILSFAIKDPDSSMYTQEVCVWTLVQMVESEIRARRKTPERSSVFADIKREGLDLFLEEAVRTATGKDYMHKIETRQRRLLNLILSARGEGTESSGDSSADAFAF